MTSASEPTAAIRPLRTATASASGCLGFTVQICAWRMMRSAAGRESAARAASGIRAPSALAAIMPVAAMNAAAVNRLQNIGNPTLYLRPLEIAADLVLLIEMQFSAHAGDVARGCGIARVQAGDQAVRVESKGIEAVAPRRARRPGRTHAVADLRGDRIIGNHPRHVGEKQAFQVRVGGRIGLEAVRGAIHRHVAGIVVFELRQDEARGSGPACAPENET